MDLAAARKLARSLMDQHGLTDWQFAFDRARRRFGICSPTRKLIGLSAHLVHLNTEAEVRDTILHEIAHALTPGDNHGPRWREVCRKLGARPERCFRQEQGVRAVKAPLRIGCPRCDLWIERYRITWAIQVCRRCRGPILWEHVRSGRRYVIRRAGNGLQAVEAE
ncbi:MAG: SprT-like domain-containing protein [Phycisphaerae bacterium]|nr:SprT-like domain-containing protein [Phycisphaerae bacterium]